MSVAERVSKGGGGVRVFGGALWVWVKVCVMGLCRHFSPTSL